MGPMLEAVGARMIGVWYTLGPYDMVAIVETPNSETMARLLLSEGMAGHVRTITLQAFSEDEMGSLVQGLE